MGAKDLLEAEREGAPGLICGDLRRFLSGDTGADELDKLALLFERRDGDIQGFQNAHGDDALPRRGLGVAFDRTLASGAVEPRPEDLGEDDLHVRPKEKNIRRDVDRRRLVHPSGHGSAMGDAAPGQEHVAIADAEIFLLRRRRREDGIELGKIEASLGNRTEPDGWNLAETFFHEAFRFGFLGYSAVNIANKS